MNTRALSVCFVVALLTPVVAAEGLLEKYDLVGTDPANDAPQPFAPGVNYPACGTGLGCGKFDITELEMANDGDLLQVKLNTFASYSGTTSIIYAVHFTVGTTKYLTCWNVQSAGQTGSSQDVVENTVACSRFTGETQVGPATKADGVQQSTDAAGKPFVRWEVPKADIEGATELTAITAEIWSRGPSNCCVGSTSQSPYTWNRADVAPDAGAWSYSLTAAAPSLSLSFSMEPKNATAAPGGTVAVSLQPNLTGEGAAAFNWSVVDLPEGWDAAFDPANGTLTAGENATHNLTITVPSDAENQTLNLTVLLSAENNLTASANLTITVDATLRPALATSSGAANTTTSSAASNETAAPADGDGIPNLGLVAVTLGFVAVAAAMRARRRD